MRRGNIERDGDYAILYGKGNSPMAIVDFKGKSTNADSAAASVVLPYETSSSPWSWWGDDNLFPQNVMKDLEKNSIALKNLMKSRNVHYGRGLIAYREIDGVKEVVKDPEVVEFFRVNRLNLQQIEVIDSLEIFANAWIECVVNKGRDKINKVYVKDPTYCRWEKMNASSLRIENVYYSAQWEYSVNENNSIKIPTYDPSKYNGDRYSDKNFIFPLFYKSMGKTYYHLAVWHGVRQSGWLDIANKIPAMKLAIMKNQMTIKYHIEIPGDYFTVRYPSPDYTKEQREAKEQEMLDKLDAFLSNYENSGKSFVSFTQFNRATNQNFPGWKINVLDNKLKDDAYLPDSQAGNSEIMSAVGIDSAILGGIVPGGKMGAGSGSNIREAYWALNADMGPSRVVSTSYLYFIRDFNKWDPTIQFDYIVVDTSQTMANNPSKTEKRIDSNSTQ